MTGAEIAAVGKAVEAVAKKALDQDDKAGDELRIAAQDTAEMRAAARTFAARVAVKERIKLKLYQPFARMIGVSRAYFEEVFPEEMAAKTAAIPDEHFTTPPASVAVPALQGLSYSFEEDSLKELYLNLLTAASDDRRIGDTHPAFAEVIKQISSREAKSLDQLLALRQIPAAKLKVNAEIGAGFTTILTHLVPLHDDNTGEPEDEPDAPVWIDNWVRLGLVEATYTEFQLGDSIYDWVTTRPEFIRATEEWGSERLDWDKGLVKRTAFGLRFHRAVGPPTD